MRFTTTTTTAAFAALAGLSTLAAAAETRDPSCSRPDLVIKVHTGACANAASLAAHVVGTGPNSSQVLEDNPVRSESTSFFTVPAPFQGRVYVTESGGNSTSVQGVAFEAFDGDMAWAQAVVDEEDGSNSTVVVAPVKVNFATFAKWQGVEAGGASIFNSRVGDPLVVSYCGST